MNVHTEKSNAEHAAEWLERLKTATHQQRAEFVKWLSQSPLHVREVLLALHLDDALRGYFRRHRVDVKAQLDSAINVHELGDRIATLIREGASQTPRPASITQLRPALTFQAAARSKRSKWFVAAAACVVGFFVAVTVAVQFASENAITTQAGEWQKKILEDGTIVRIGPRTKLIVQFTKDRRDVRLIRGEALFYVAKNPARPFIVQTDFASAQAVGTAFAVSLYEPGEVRVTVKEGIVAVARPSYSPGRRNVPDGATGQVTLLAGHEVVVMRTGKLTPKEVDLETALAWANVELLFDDVPLKQAVLEFNRRNKLQIKILDEALFNRFVTGKFDAADPKTFGMYLERHGAVAVMDEDEGTILIAPYPEQSTIRAKN